MTPEKFNQWLAEMKSAGLIERKQDVAELLGVTDDTVTNFAKRGTDHRTALACRALLHRMEAYG